MIKPSDFEHNQISMCVLDYQWLVKDGGVPLIDLLISSGTCSAGGEARRLIQQGGLRINELPINNIAYKLTKDDLVCNNKSNGLYMVLRTGKSRVRLFWFIRERSDNGDADE